MFPVGPFLMLRVLLRRYALSAVFHLIHHRAALHLRADNEETLYQVYLPQRVVFYLSV